MVLVCEITLAMGQSTLQVQWVRAHGLSVCNNTCNGSEHLVIVSEIILAMAQSTWSSV